MGVDSDLDESTSTSGVVAHRPSIQGKVRPVNSVYASRSSYGSIGTASTSELSEMASRGATPTEESQPNTPGFMTAGGGDGPLEVPSPSISTSTAGGGADVTPKLKRVKSSFGSKSLGYWASCCLNLNNCMGPAMVLLPLVSQQAGWFTPTLALLVVFVFSTFAGTMLCEAMQRIPGNSRFSAVPRIEFTTAVRHYYGTKAYYVFQILYTISLQALNIASMIISSQVVDNFIFKVTGNNYALDYKTWSIVTGCSGFSKDAVGQCLEDSNIFPVSTVISLGFIVSMLICLPFGYLNLDDNMWFQWFSLIGLLLFTLEFVVQFFLNMIPSSKYYVGPHYDPGLDMNRTGLGPELLPFFKVGGQGYVFGLATFAYSYIVTIPSWVNEKKPEVSVNKAVWVPATLGLVMKLAIGLMGGMSFYLLGKNNQPLNGADNILIELLHPRMPAVTQYSAYLWNLTTLIPGIPVLGIYVRYNLLSGKVFGPVQSAFWGVVAPWIVTLFLYEQSALSEVCNWIALIAAGFTNFVVPAMLYYRSLTWYPSSEERAEQRTGTSGASPGHRDDEVADLREEERLITSDTVNEIVESGDLYAQQQRVHAVPKWLRIAPKKLAAGISIFFTLLSVITIGCYIYAAVALGSTD
eukprot:scpid48664/ scgid4434/ 